MDRKGFSAIVIALVVLILVIVGIVVFIYFDQPRGYISQVSIPPPNSLGSSSTDSSANTTSDRQQVSATVSSTWLTYTNSDFGYSLIYPGPVGSLAEASQNVATIVIDPKSDPMYVCADKNSHGWSSRQFFESWKTNPPHFTSDMIPNDEYPCADYPSYAHITTSTTMVDEASAYVVTSMRGSYKTVCTYIATAKILLALCLPPEDPKYGAWTGHYTIYQTMLSSVMFAP